MKLGCVDALYMAWPTKETAQLGILNQPSLVQHQTNTAISVSPTKRVGMPFSIKFGKLS